MATAPTTSPKASCATTSQVTIDPVPRKASPHTEPPVTRPPTEPPLTALDIPNGSLLAHLKTYITTLRPTPADYATKQAAFTKTADPPQRLQHGSMHRSLPQGALAFAKIDCLPSKSSNR
jgi:hypothetical protein